MYRTKQGKIGKKRWDCGLQTSSIPTRESSEFAGRVEAIKISISMDTGFFGQTKAA